MIAAVLLGWAIAMTGWGIYWRAQAEDLVDENFALRFGGFPRSAEVEGEAEVITAPAAVVVEPSGDGGMTDLIDDLLLEALMPQQRRPGGAS